jgi:hypothetical protein
MSLSVLQPDLDPGPVFPVNEGDLYRVYTPANSFGQYTKYNTRENSYKTNAILYILNNAGNIETLTLTGQLEPLSKLTNIGLFLNSAAFSASDFAAYGENSLNKKASLWSGDCKRNINNLKGFYVLQNNTVVEMPYFSYAYNLYGDLAPYTELEIATSIKIPLGVFESELNNIILDKANFRTNKKFTYTVDIPRIPVRPQLIFINHFPSYIGLQTNGTTPGLKKYYFVNAGINRSILPSQSPWYDSYIKYSHDILEPNYSIIPEYSIQSSIYENKVFKLDGNLNFTVPVSHKNISSDEANMNLIANEKILDTSHKKKIRLTLNGIKKFIPQKGFYPNERIEQIANLFQKSYINLTSDQMYSEPQGFVGTAFCKNYPDNLGKNSNEIINITSQFGCPFDGQLLALTQPIFGPGVLINSLRAGVATDWSIYKSDIDPTSPNYDGDAIRKGLPSFYSSIPLSASTMPTLETLSSYNVVEKLNDKITISDILLKDSSLRDKLSKKYLHYLNPSFYGLDIGLINVLLSNTGVINMFPLTSADVEGSITKDFIQYNTQYTNSITNFIESIKEFYTPNDSSFFSKNKTCVLDNKTYKMEIFIRRDEKITSALGQTISIGEDKLRISEASYYGPVTRYSSTAADLKDRLAVTDSPAYAPYAPPYYYGESSMTLSFTPSDYFQGRDILLQNVIHNAQRSFSTKNIDDAFAARTIGQGYLASPAYLNKNTIESAVSININSDGLLEVGLTLEAPVLDFYEKNLSLQNFQEKTQDNPLILSKTGSFWTNTLWGGTGNIPNGGIKFGIRDVPGFGSMAELLSLPREEKQVCKFADSVTISEAVLAIPYIYDPNSTECQIVVAPEEEQIGNSQKVYFFTVSDYLLNNHSANSAIKFTLENKNKFNIPEHLDLTKYVAYIFPFDLNLSKADLAKSWQGFLPDIGQEKLHDSKVVEQYVSQNDYFEGLIPPANLRFKLFKVKKAGVKQNAEANWPHDFYSIVEMANLELEEIIENTDSYRKNVITAPKIAVLSNLSDPLNVKIVG